MMAVICIILVKLRSPDCTGSMLGAIIQWCVHSNHVKVLWIKLDFILLVKSLACCWCLLCSLF